MLSLLFLAAAALATDVVDSVVATVNGKKITRGEITKDLQPQIEALLSENKGAVPLEKVEKMVYEAVIERIEEMLLIEEAEAALTEDEKSEISKEVGRQIEELLRQAGSQTALRKKLELEGKTVEERREQIRKEEMLRTLLKDKVEHYVIVSPREIREYYEAHARDYHTPERATFRQILLKFSDYTSGEEARASAERLRSQLLAGADFASIAKERSRDPHASEGGLWENVGRGTLLPELEEIIFSQAAGEISPPTRSPLGYHLLQVVSREEARTIPFAEVQDSIRKTLREKAFRERLAVYLENLKARAHVTVNLRPAGQESVEGKP